LVNKMEHPVVTSQRFFETRLGELVDKDSIVVYEYSRGRTCMQVAEAIILDIRYPLYWGVPDDKHIWNAFHLGYKWCKTVSDDFWQKATETISVKAGDCEDSSIAFVACARCPGVSDWLGSDSVFEVFGEVRDAATYTLLGGHGWVVSKHIPDEQLRLYESTLDQVPAEYPVVEGQDPGLPVEVNGLLYKPEWVWNDEVFTVVGSMDHRNRSKKSKESPEKYEAISRAWGVDTKPAKAMRKSRARKVRKLLRLT